ncbi:MAG: hypothetical protein EZS28_016316 [Streblomastix strix]|uniref:Uncharacterized protein n=1 Tax=Streblomastix strix TaxID=222440 RepID=A0A5J4W001_9EUKA|nr:MAG: hypothetical protein EZS28_016316 [Streblomastix strix]
MALTRHVNELLENIDQDKHDIQSSIHKELNFSYNSINLLIGQRGGGKTYNIFRELIKLSQLKSHCYSLETAQARRHEVERSLANGVGHEYTLFIYVTDTNNDQTYQKMKHLIKIPTKIVPYAEINSVLDELIEGKQAYDQVIQHKIGIYLQEESKQNVLNKTGANDFRIKSPHKIVLFDDAMSIFKNKTSPLFKKLFKN